MLCWLLWRQRGSVSRDVHGRLHGRLLRHGRDCAHNRDVRRAVLVWHVRLGRCDVVDMLWTVQRRLLWPCDICAHVCDVRRSVHCGLLLPCRLLLGDPSNLSCRLILPCWLWRAHCVSVSRRLHVDGSVRRAYVHCDADSKRHSHNVVHTECEQLADVDG